jgi:hypothetical protein
LVSITYGDKASIFAYADDDEFITDNVSEWDDLPILKEVIGKARAKGLKKLERICNPYREGSDRIRNIALRWENEGV